MNKSRLLYIDKLKALAMLLVIMGHTMYFCMYDELKSSDPILNIICSFHVPLFFFLSGFVISSPPDFRKFLGKSYKFLMPMLVVGFINALLINRVRDFFFNGGYNGYWYLLTLTIFYLLLMPFWLTKDKKGITTFIMDIIIAIIIYGLLFFSMKLSNTIIFALNPGGAFAFWPFFIIGFICRKYALTDYITGKKWLSVILPITYIIIIVVYFDRIDCLPLVLDFSIALIAIAALIALFYSFGNSKTFIDRELLFIGNHTLDIYIYHYFFIRFISLKFLIGQNILIELLVTTILTLVIAYASISIGLTVRIAIRKSKHLYKTLPLLLLFCSTVVQAENDAENNYPPLDCSMQLNETNLPIVFIDTRSEGSSTNIISQNYRIIARMKIINNPDGLNYGDTLTHPSQTVDYEGWVAIRYRGNSSFIWSKKKSYNFKTMKTTDPDGEKTNPKLLGMPRDNTWALLALYGDRSLVRDALVFQLARPYFEYIPQYRYCEMVLDGIYYGVFLLSETISKGTNRLDLDNPGVSGDRLTGGYQLQIDRNNEAHFTSKYKAVDSNGNVYGAYNEIYFQYKHPEYQEMTPEQIEYIQQRMDKMEDVLASDSFTHPDTGYRQYLDVMSFIDQQLSQEFSGNIDGYRLSTNIYKRRDSVDPRFKTTLWDFDIAFGNSSATGATRTDFWRYQNTYFTDDNCYNKIPFWWMRLMEDPAYVKQLKERWIQYRQENYTFENIESIIDSITTLLNDKGAQERNNIVWKLLKNSSYNVEINRLKQWIRNRVAWMDEQLIYNVPTSIRPVTMPDGNLKKTIFRYYNLQGIQLSEPPERGVYIVRFNDGSSMKIVKSH